MNLFPAIAILFVVMDPIGNIPLVASSLQNVDKKRKYHVLLRELLIALFTLLFFLFIGKHLLGLLDISQQSLTISGGIILLLISIRMTFSNSISETTNDEPFIVPIAIPSIAGPSAIAVLMLFMSQHPNEWLKWVGALTIAWSLTGIILMCSTFISKLLGKQTMTACGRLMGLLLTAISIEMIVNGIKQLIIGV